MTNQLEALDELNNLLSGNWAFGSDFEDWARKYKSVLRQVLSQQCLCLVMCGAVGKEACMNKDQIAEDCRECNANMEDEMAANKKALEDAVYFLRKHLTGEDWSDEKELMSAFDTLVKAATALYKREEAALRELRKDGNND